VAVPYLYEPTWERMIRAVERVRERCDRAARALSEAGIQYAVAGGNAVANWVARVDEGSVRNTRDVDIIIRRQDLDAARAALEGVGFVYGQSYGIDFFLDGPNSRPSEGIHLVFAGEKVKDTDPVAAPDIAETTDGVAFRVLTLEALVRMKLVANRDKDRTHIRDLIGVGLVDSTWPDRFPEVLAERLRQILANPEG
jgi:hypothetical protein